MLRHHFTASHYFNVRLFVLLLGRDENHSEKEVRWRTFPCCCRRRKRRIPHPWFHMRLFPGTSESKGKGGAGNKEITSFLFLLGRADLQESRIHLLFACRPACDMCEHTTTIREQGEWVRPVSFSIVRLGLPSASASSSFFLSSSFSIRCCLSEIYCHRHEIYRSLPPPSVAVKRRPSEIPLH